MTERNTLRRHQIRYVHLIFSCPVRFASNVCYICNFISNKDYIGIWNDASVKRQRNHPLFN